jgi:hypothetical protein
MVSFWNLIKDSDRNKGENFYRVPCQIRDSTPISKVFVV